jgi:hypothetical protein
MQELGKTHEHTINSLYVMSKILYKICKKMAYLLKNIAVFSPKMGKIRKIRICHNRLSEELSCIMRIKLCNKFSRRCR